MSQVHITRKAPLYASPPGKSLDQRECAHRVGTSLQTIASIVRRYQRQIAISSDKETAFEALDAVQRSLTATAMVQQLLAPGARNPGNFLELLSELGAHLQTVYERPDVQIAIAQTAPVPAGQAQRMAIIVTELVSNALRHAFARDSHGTIAIAIESLPFDGCRLTVRDDGAGLAPDYVCEDPQRGLGLSFEMARDAGGTMELMPQTVGTLWQVDLPAGDDGEE